MSKAPDGGWGWIVVAAVTLSNLAVLPIQQCFGLIFEQRFKKLGITATETSLILHLNASIMCSLGLINAPLLKRFSYRTVAFLGTGFIFLGILSAAFAHSMTTIVLAYCIFIAIGQGMMYPAISLALNTYFRKKRSIAMGLTITLTGLGPIGMPQVIARLLEGYGTTGTLLILAGIALHSFIGASLLRPLSKKNDKISDVEQRVVILQSRDPAGVGEEGRDLSSGQIPEEVELLKASTKLGIGMGSSKEGNTDPDETPIVEEPRIDSAPRKTGRKNIFSKLSESLDLDLLKDDRFLVIILGMGVTLVSELNFSQMIPFVFAELAELSQQEIATLMSIQASADITGRLCVPLLAQKFGWSSKTLYASSLVGSTLARSILASWSSSYPIVVAVSLLIGIAKGTKAVFQALVIPDNVPLVKLPAASGLLMIFNGVLSMALGPLIGLVHDETHGYVAALHFTSSISMSCVILWICESFYLRYREKPRGIRTRNDDEDK